MAENLKCCFVLGGLADNNIWSFQIEVADIRLGPQMRRGIAELDGEGEVVGAVVVLRYGENAQRTIGRVKARLDELKAGLPEGVEIVETYNRATLIERAVATLRQKLLEEVIVVVLVCLVFLFHFRSSLVVVISLPLGVLAAFVVMVAHMIQEGLLY